MRRFKGFVRRGHRDAVTPPVQPSTVRGEYASLGRCGAEPLGEDRALTPVLPCSLPAGHTGGHRSPSGWAWPQRGAS